MKINYAHFKTQEMEHIYTVHTKIIEGETYYFVKKLLTLIGFKGLADVLVGYGMHTNFEKACSIAGITDTSTRNRLLSDFEAQTKPQKPTERYTVQMKNTVNRWLAERGVEVLN